MYFCNLIILWVFVVCVICYTCSFSGFYSIYMSNKLISAIPLLRLSWWPTWRTTRRCPWVLWCLGSIFVSTQNLWRRPTCLFPSQCVAVSHSMHTLLESWCESTTTQLVCLYATHCLIKRQRRTNNQSPACAYVLAAYSKTYNGLFL